MPTYLVTGATGQQGGAVVDHLLAAGAKIHAVVRDTSSPKAAALREKGVVLFQGEHENPDEVFRAAAEGCTGLFLNPTVFEPGKARAQGDAIIKAAKAGGGAGLTTVVLSSTSRADEIVKKIHIATEIHPWLGAYWTAKAEVEMAVEESGFQHWTILQPPVLMYDLLLPASAGPHAFPLLPREAEFRTTLNDDRTMPYLDQDDIGRFSAAVFANPAKFSGHRINMAGDNLSTKQVCEILSRVSGVEVKLHKRTPEEIEASKGKEFFQDFEKLNNVDPWYVDVEAMEAKYGIRATRFEEFFVKNKEKLLDSLPPRSAAFL
jgi:uncharacterized protein YbjT (DUF2867 family)